MKMKRVLSGVMASAIAVSGASVFSASAAENTTIGDNYVSGIVGAYFQTDVWSARNAFGATWGPETGDPAAVPYSVVGIASGDYGWDTNATVKDGKIEGDGTYTVGFKTCGTINTAASAKSKSWYINEEKTLTRMGSPWSILGKYEPGEITAETTQDNIEWAINDKSKAYSFNVLGISTDIPVFYDKDNNKCYLDKEMTKEVTVSDVTVDMCGKTVKADDVKYEMGGGLLQISLINIWGASSIDASAFPEQDGDINITFTVKGLGKKEATPAAKTDLSKKGKVTLKKKKVAYTGKALKPAVTVKVGKTTLKNGTDYSLKFKNNKKPGKATVTVTGKGKYKGSKSASFIIVPKKAAAPKLNALCCGQVKVTLKKDKTATGYKIRYSTDKKFKKGVKTVTIKKNSTTTKTIKKLKGGKKYYFQAASYVKVGKKTYAGAFSAKKAVIVKK